MIMKAHFLLEKDMCSVCVCAAMIVHTNISLGSQGMQAECTHGRHMMPTSQLACSYVHTAKHTRKPDECTCDLAWYAAQSTIVVIIGPILNGSLAPLSQTSRFQSGSKN